MNKVEGFLVPGATAVDASIALQEKLAERDFDLPPGYKLVMAGDADEQKEALGLLATVPFL